MYIKYLLFVFCLSNAIADPNTQILQILREMPRGGKNTTIGEAYPNLVKSCTLRNNTIEVNPELAQPSFCYGATYLVLLKFITQKGIISQPELYDWSKLEPKGSYGYGIWGRWSANGPGTARLFYETKAGYNFNSLDHAKAGDFLKIFWTDAIGLKEKSDSVIYLKHTADTLTFWSSNKVKGYSLKTVKLSSINHMIFSRLLYPVRLFSNIPESDQYLATLHAKKSSYTEVLDKCGITNISSTNMENIKK